MTIEQLHQLARDVGSREHHPSTSQTQRIRHIQLRHGSDPCFLTEERHVSTDICEWSRECRKLKAQWLYQQMPDSRGNAQA